MTAISLDELTDGRLQERLDAIPEPAIRRVVLGMIDASLRSIEQRVADARSAVDVAQEAHT